MNKPVMLPPTIPDSASGAEKKIFEELKALSLDCTIFHSVGLAEHRNNAYGEIDDEGQDLIRFNYCECFELILKGGLEKGNWCII